MTQEELFNADVYVRRAYDNLVLANSALDNQELESLKWQLLQAWLSLQDARRSAISLHPPLEFTDDEPY